MTAYTTDIFNLKRYGISPNRALDVIEDPKLSTFETRRLAAHAFLVENAFDTYSETLTLTSKPTFSKGDVIRISNHQTGETYVAYVEAITESVRRNETALQTEYTVDIRHAISEIQPYHA